MASPGVYPDYSSMAAGRVRIPVQFTAGASGAVPSLTAFSQAMGVESVSKPTGTGIYKIVFDETYEGMLSMSKPVIVQASYAKTGACDMMVTALEVSDPDEKSVTVLFTAGDDGDPVDLASGDLVVVEFDLQYLNLNS